MPRRFPDVVNQGVPAPEEALNKWMGKVARIAGKIQAGKRLVRATRGQETSSGKPMERLKLASLSNNLTKIHSMYILAFVLRSGSALSSRSSLD
jgi:hypothetical protein